MANTDILQLPVAVSVDGSEWFPLVQGNTTKRAETGLLIGPGEGSVENANTVLAGPTSGAAAVPTFRSLVVADLPVATVPKGGTGNSTATAYALIAGGTTSTGAFQSVGAGSSGQALLSNGASALPTFQSLPSAIGQALTKADDTNVTLTLGGTPTTALLSATSITAGWTGTLAAPRGGTGFGSYTVGDILYASSTNALSKLPASTSGYHLQAAGAGVAPTWSGFLQSGTGAVTRTWQDKARDAVSVKDFGAVGDGVTNDTTAITNAVAACNRLYFPAGTYLCGPVSLPSNIVIFGDGAVSIIKATGTLSGNYLWLMNAVSDVEIFDLRFSVSASYTLAAALYVSGGSLSINIHDVSNLTSGAHTLYASSISDCKFERIVSTDALSSGFYINTASRCRVAECRVSGASAENNITVITGNDMEIVNNTVSGAANFGIGCATSNRVLIDGNTVFDTILEGVQLTDCTTCTISNNMVYAPLARSTDFGISLDNPVVNGYVGHLVVNNFIQSCGSSGIGLAASVSYCTIADNNVVNCNTGNYAFGAGVTIYSTGSQNNTIIGNKLTDFSGKMQYGVYEWNASGLGSPSNNIVQVNSVYGAVVSSYGLNASTAALSQTGTGALVLANSPTLITPNLGTPSAGTLTSCTGLPISTGVSGLGSGVATFLATPTSANLKAALTDETGSGAAVFATSPTLVTPILGTPTSGTLTNCTGLPVAGVTGLATSTTAGRLARYSNTTGSQVQTTNLFEDGVGLVGIGTTSPSRLLTVYKNDSALAGNPHVLLDQQGAGDSAMQFEIVGVRAWNIGIDQSDSSKFKIDSTADNSWSGTRLCIDPSSGAVGLGTSNPVNTLDVSGSVGFGAPVTKTADFTLAATENDIINNKAGSACVATLPAASSWTGRRVRMKTIQAQAINSASSNVVPKAGGAAGTAIVAGVAGNWAEIVSDGTNWVIMSGT